MAPIYAQVLHGRGKNYRRRDDTEIDGDVNTTVVAAPRRRPQQVDVSPIPEKPESISAGRTRRFNERQDFAQQTEFARKGGIIASNLAASAKARQKQQDSYDQADRNSAVINRRELIAAKGKNRMNDAADVAWSSVGPKQITAKAPVDRAARAAEVTARPVVPIIGAAQKVAQDVGADVANQVAAEQAIPGSPEDTSPMPSDVQAGAPPQAPVTPQTPATIPNDADYINAGTDEMLAKAKTLAAASRAGIDPNRQQAMDEAAAITAASPRARQAAGDRAAVQAMTPTNYRTPAPAAAPAPGVDPQYDALKARADLGATALMNDRSLEQIERERVEDRQYGQQRGLVEAANPPDVRGGGTAPTAKPPAGLNRMDVDLQAAYQAAENEMKQLEPMIYDFAQKKTIENPAFVDARNRMKKAIEDQVARGAGSAQTGGAPETPPPNVHLQPGQSLVRQKSTGKYFIQQGDGSMQEVR